ncbi:10171_t:CDS:2 [Diversispora eburnea]|uniref:10171_t:CDS:1 n=1 Tax=Diversispora eburnea TaxID=1213867 RepID=A0A9N8WIP7_9GLOM|nr:10171_t:CDS:2 [Diversispora eburnea]
MTKKKKSISSVEVWEAIAILEEKFNEEKNCLYYLVQWAGKDEFGNDWEPTWEPESNCGSALIEEWNERKAGVNESKKGADLTSQCNLGPSNKNESRKRSMTKSASNENLKEKRQKVDPLSISYNAIESSSSLNIKKSQSSLGKRPALPIMRVVTLVKSIPCDGNNQKNGKKIKKSGDVGDTSLENMSKKNMTKGPMTDIQNSAKINSNIPNLLLNVHNSPIVPNVHQKLCKLSLPSRSGRVFISKKAHTKRKIKKRIKAVLTPPSTDLEVSNKRVRYDESYLSEEEETIISGQVITDNPIRPPITNNNDNVIITRPLQSSIPSNTSITLSNTSSNIKSTHHTSHINNKTDSKIPSQTQKSQYNPPPLLFPPSNNKTNTLLRLPHVIKPKPTPQIIAQQINMSDESRFGATNKKPTFLPNNINYNNELTFSNVRPFQNSQNSSNSNTIVNVANGDVNSKLKNRLIPNSESILGYIPPETEFHGIKYITSRNTKVVPPENKEYKQDKSQNVCIANNLNNMNVSNNLTPKPFQFSSSNVQKMSEEVDKLQNEVSRISGFPTDEKVNKREVVKNAKRQLTKIQTELEKSKGEKNTRSSNQEENKKPLNDTRLEINMSNNDAKELTSLRKTILEKSGRIEEISNKFEKCRTELDEEIDLCSDDVRPDERKERLKRVILEMELEFIKESYNISMSTTKFLTELKLNCALKSQEDSNVASSSSLSSSYSAPNEYKPKFDQTINTPMKTVQNRDFANNFRNNINRQDIDSSNIVETKDNDKNLVIPTPTSTTNVLNGSSPVKTLNTNANNANGKKFTFFGPTNNTSDTTNTTSNNDKPGQIQNVKITPIPNIDPNNNNTRLQENFFCEWNSCKRSFNTKPKLRFHLIDVHLREGTHKRRCD